MGYGLAWQARIDFYVPKNLSLANHLYSDGDDRRVRLQPQARRKSISFLGASVNDIYPHHLPTATSLQLHLVTFLESLWRASGGLHAHMYR